MKEIKECTPVKIYNGEIEVRPYLTYAEIQSICDAVCRFDNWAERQQNVDILLLHFATNLTDEEIEAFGHEMLLQSGVIDEVKANVKNFNRVEESIEYTQSTSRAVCQILAQFPAILETAKKVKKRGNKPSK